MNKESDRIERFFDDDQGSMDFGPLTDVFNRIDRVMQETWTIRKSGGVFTPNFNDGLKRVVYDTYVRLGSSSEEMNISALIQTTVLELEDKIKEAEKERRYGGISLEIIQEVLVEANRVFTESSEFKIEEIYRNNE